MFGLKLKRNFCMAVGEALYTLRLKKGAPWQEIKESYTYLQKRYHPDASKDSSVQALDQIKKINIAYKVVEQYYIENNLKTEAKDKSSSDPNITYSQWKSRTEKELYDEIYQQYFGSDKEAINRPENEEKKLNFEGEYQRAVRNNLGKNEGSFLDEEFWKYQKYEGSGDFYFKNQYEKRAQESQTESFSQTLSNMSPVYRISLGAFSLIVLGMGAYVITQENVDPFQGKLNADRIESIRQKALDYRVSEKQKLIDEAFDSQNPMKAWPIGQKSSNSMDQLIDFTIFPDIKLYYIEAQYFYKDLDEITFMSHKDIHKKPLTGIRQSHMVSLTLEAERSLQNIFIKAEDLKRIIKEKGYYECPGIFMRYKGFVYFRHRNKPIVLKDVESIPNNQTLSLFEIFHKYYSPIPEVFDEYYEYRLSHGGYIQDTTTLENSSWIGNVTFNHRNIPKLLIKGDEKNIFMWRGKAYDDPQEARYIKVWNTIYNPPEAPIGQETPKDQVGK